MQNPDLWHGRERMNLVCFIWPLCSTEELQTSQADPGECSCSEGVLPRLGRCASLASCTRSRSGLTVLRKCVYLAWGGERKGGLVERRAAVPHLQWWGCSSIMRSCLRAVAAQYDSRCLRVEKLKLAFSKPARTPGRVGTPIFYMCVCTRISSFSSNWYFTLLSFFCLSWHSPIVVPFHLNPGLLKKKVLARWAIFKSVTSEVCYKIH